MTEEIGRMAASDAVAVQQWITEKRWRRHTKAWFRTECKAYHQLRTLQGLCIPKFYGATEFDETWQAPPGIVTEVRGILLEFIDGLVLEEIDSSTPLAMNNPHIGQAAVNCLNRIVPLGVLHGDPRLPNIMVRHDGRVFLLDFALAIFRGDASEEDWSERAASEEETYLIKNFLHEKRLRDLTPPEPYWSVRTGFRTYNRFIRVARESWRTRYYYPVHNNRQFEVKVDERGKEFYFDYSQWRVNQEAAVTRKKALDQFRDS